MSAPHQKQKALPNKFLGKELRIGLEDGRIIVGVLASFQGNGDMIVMNPTEFREFTAEMNHGVAETGVKQSAMTAIPFKYVVSMHMRKAGVPSVSEVVATKMQQQLAARVAVAGSE